MKLAIGRCWNAYVFENPNVWKFHLVFWLVIRGSWCNVRTFDVSSMSQLTIQAFEHLNAQAFKRSNMSVRGFDRLKSQTFGCLNARALEIWTLQHSSDRKFERSNVCKLDMVLGSTTWGPWLNIPNVRNFECSNIWTFKRSSLVAEWDPAFVTLGCEIKHLRSDISDLRSQIRDLRSDPWDQRPQTRNPRPKTLDQRHQTRNLRSGSEI